MYTIVKMIHKKINCSLHVLTLQDPWMFILNPNLLPEHQRRVYSSSATFHFRRLLRKTSYVNFLLLWTFLQKFISSRNGPVYSKVHRNKAGTKLKSGSDAKTHACYGEDGWKKMVRYKLWCAHSHSCFRSKCEAFIVWGRLVWVHVLEVNLRCHCC